MGVPVLVGGLAGDTRAGLMATIGGFTALYGRPYLGRAALLALVAVSLAGSVSLGVAAATTGWGAVLVVAVIAMAATPLCNALAVGPPGAYMFTLACAAGTALHAAHPGSWHAGLLVMGGGAFACGAHGRCRAVASGAGEGGGRRRCGRRGAVRRGLGTSRQDVAGHWAATALHESWSALVSFRRVQPGPGTTLGRLRALTRGLHLLFVDVIRVASRGEPPPPRSAARARRLARAARRPAGSGAGAEEVPLGRPGAAALLREAVRPGPVLLTAGRVGAAAVVAGALGAAFDLGHAYWTIAAAVLILHQGQDRARTSQRALERVAGAFAGLLVAAGLLAAHPAGAWPALTVAALQFTVEMFVVRDYALAVAFIAPLALTIASGGQRVADLAGLLLARGEDTAIGRAVALAVLALTARRAPFALVPAAVAGTLHAAGETATHVAHGEVRTPAARTARRGLQVAALRLLQAYDASTGASAAVRRDAERLWPAVVATERPAYRPPAACWSAERDGGTAVPGAASLPATLADLAAAVRQGTGAPEEGEPPKFLAEEVAAVRESLVRAETEPAP